MKTIESLYQEFITSKGISTDTRFEVKDKLFFALKGENFDGNLFVAEALSKGCRMVITENQDLKGRAGVVVVSSTLETLQQLAHDHRRQSNATVLAITGSNGKTTTKELVAQVLSKKYKVLATEGNLNNHIGVPLTLLKLKQEKIVVIEMGANHPGEIARLAAIAAPDVGLITNIGKAHLEGFGSEQGVLNAKGELYEYLSAHGGKTIVDGSDPLLLKKASDIGIEPLVIGPESTLRVSARIVSQTPFLGIEIRIDGITHKLNTNLVGAYNLQNIIQSVGVGLHFEVPSASILEAIGNYVPRNQRSQFMVGASNKVILDAYNANPDSMREAINGLLAYSTSPCMVILGDMAELGTTSENEHLELIQWIKTLSIDRILLVGPNFHQFKDTEANFEVFKERRDLEEFLTSEKPQGYHILIKGSRIMELEKILELVL